MHVQLSSILTLINYNPWICVFAIHSVRQIKRLFWTILAVLCVNIKSIIGFARKKKRYFVLVIVKVSMM